MDMMNSYGLDKLILDATHCGGGALDQISNTPVGNMIDVSTTVDSLSGFGSDHYLALWHHRVSLEKKSKSIVYRKLEDVDSGNFSDLNDLIDGIDQSDSFEKQVHDLSTVID
jgi:hypothetical protein